MSDPEDGDGRSDCPGCGSVCSDENCEKPPTWWIEFPDSMNPKTGVTPWTQGCDDHAEDLLLRVGKIYGPGIMHPITEETCEPRGDGQGDLAEAQEARPHEEDLPGPYPGDPRGDRERDQGCSSERSETEEEVSESFRDNMVPLSGGKPTTPEGSVPNPEKLPDGQYKDHWILSDAERAKGFVRPVRTKYRHVGVRPKHPLRDLTEEEKQRYAAFGYEKFEAYPESESPTTGRYWTAKQLSSGCGTSTTMPLKIAETYAAQPSAYGSTFCCGCGDYFPVGPDGEFEWEDGSKVGS